MEIKIIYEDNHLLVVEKPANILSQGDRTGDADMVTLLKEDLKIRYNKPGNVYLGLLHRLDRPVGGVMVFAKTSKAASRLSDQIRTRKFKKRYLALVDGRPSKSRDSLVHYLLKDNRKNMVEVVEEGRQGAKKAILDYKLLDTARGYSLVEIDLHTGRPHQIRVQLAAIGHPLYGDQRYNLKGAKEGEQIALWSYEIICSHPTLREEMSFISKPSRVEPWSWFKI